MTRPHRFAIATREESRLETRVIHGRLEERDGRIDADDRGDPELIERVNRVATGFSPSSAGGLKPAATRVVVSARRIDDQIIESAYAIVTAGRLTIVTDRDHLAGDSEWLRGIAIDPESSIADYRGVPMVWLRGAGSVLMHEAAGHPAEKKQPPVKWPRWLRVADVPDSIDDTGERPHRANLLAGEAPRSLRRESFVHPALTRMSHVVVEAVNAPFARPSRRIEIHLLAGGHYESLTDKVTIFVAAADLVEGESRRRLAPFVIEEPRASVARAITGARGHTERYPGVICSSEGQELFARSSAPELLTVF